MTEGPLKTIVLGASGYAGGELIKILDRHPGFNLKFIGANQKKGERLSFVHPQFWEPYLTDIHPQLQGGTRRLESSDLDKLPDCEVALLALPHTASAPIAIALAEKGTMVIDLSADFRFDDPEIYQNTYGSPHLYPDQLGEWHYALPELFPVPKGHKKLAIPGCYPTAVLLAMAPFLQKDYVEDSGTIVADCMSGVTGAGRKLAENLMFGAIAEGVQAYGVGGHRHRPEIEMGISKLSGFSTKVVFTPHLIPIQRGLTATVTIPLKEEIHEKDAFFDLFDFYKEAPLVEVVEVPPQSRWVSGSGRAMVAVFRDPNANTLIALSAIDNLLKGAASQAVQAANLALGWNETTGLELIGNLP